MVCTPFIAGALTPNPLAAAEAYSALRPSMIVSYAKIAAAHPVTAEPANPAASRRAAPSTATGSVTLATSCVRNPHTLSTAGAAARTAAWDVSSIDAPLAASVSPALLTASGRAG